MGPACDTGSSDLLQRVVSGLRGKLYPGVASDVVYAPVDAAAKSTAGSRQRLTGDAVVIVQVSRMESLKGHKMHLEALGMLKDLPNWTCWMVGGAQRPAEMGYARDLHATAARLGLSQRVKFLGERSDVERLLYAANLFCQPNVGAEAFGITFVEALAAGLPVVTSAIGGGQEIVDESCGVLVPARDAASLSVALRRLVTDADLRTRMSNAAPGRARDLCEPSRQLERLTRAIENTVTGRRVA